MSRTCSLTSVKIKGSNARKSLMRSKTKGKEFSVMDVKVLATSNQNVLRTSRIRKKGLYVPWSDDDSEEEPDDETTKHVTAFTGGCESDEHYSDDDVSYDELADSYKKLYAKIEEICLKGEK
jgi:hypothetical protein